MQATDISGYFYNISSSYKHHTVLVFVILALSIRQSSSQLTGSGGVFLLPDGEQYRDKDTVEASRRAARLAMELVVKEEQVGVERIAMDNVNEDELESVRKAKENIPVFSRDTLYSRLGKGRFLRRFY